MSLTKDRELWLYLHNDCVQLGELKQMPVLSKIYESFSVPTFHACFLSIIFFIYLTTY